MLKRKRSDAEQAKATSCTTLRPAATWIKDERKRAFIQSEIRRLWKLPPTYNHNPSPNPVSIELEHLPLLRTSKYVVSLKSDGVRYLLLLSTWPHDLGGADFAVMIDRARRMYEVKIITDKTKFQGSLFDGEVVLERQQQFSFRRQVYLVFDVVATCGESHINRTYMDRMITAYDLFSIDDDSAMISRALEWDKIAVDLAGSGKIVSGGNKYGLCFRPKGCSNLRELSTLWRSTATCKYPIDGLIFTPVNEPIHIGTHTTMFKWKTDHTVDIRVNLDHDTITGLVWDDDHNEERPISQTVIRLPNHGIPETHLELDVSDHLMAVLKRSGSLVGEFTLGFSPDRTRVLAKLLKIRPDKDAPNRLVTIQRTLVNILENITITTLIQVTTEMPVQ